MNQVIVNNKVYTRLTWDNKFGIWTPADNGHALGLWDSHWGWQVDWSITEQAKNAGIAL